MAALFLLAVMFLFLDAHLVAALQVVVYAGAIMVLFLFVIMLLSLQEEPSETRRCGWRLVAAAAASLFALAVIRAVWVRGVGAVDVGMGAAPPAGFGTTAALSERLFTQYALPFEITSILLLVAIVGAVAVAKRKLR